MAEKYLLPREGEICFSKNGSGTYAGQVSVKEINEPGTKKGLVCWKFPVKPET